MSRTDVHAPYWVQVMRAAQDHEWYGYEDHHHDKFDCNIDDEIFIHPSRWRSHKNSWKFVPDERTRWNSCDHEIKWSYCSRFYGRPRCADYLRKQYWGAERARVRNQLKAGHYEVEPSRTRSSVKWDMD